MSVPDMNWSAMAETATSEPRLQVRRHVDDSEMDITPMIDITFLLLIFFVVASKMDHSADVALPPADHGVAVATKHSVIVTIAAGSGGGGAQVYKGDGVDPQTLVDTSDLALLEEELERYVVDTVLEDPLKSRVLLKAAGALKHREVARVSEIVSRVAEVQGLYIAVLEEQ